MGLNGSTIRFLRPRWLLRLFACHQHISIYSLVFIFQTQIENILNLGREAYHVWNFHIQKASIIINLFSHAKLYSEKMQGL